MDLESFWRGKTPSFGEIHTVSIGFGILKRFSEMGSQMSYTMISIEFRSINRANQSVINQILLIAGFSLLRVGLF
ncbi:MAG: hypothetical protein AB2693_17565 [Candidatus Thiodiazotropha sp.]